MTTKAEPTYLRVREVAELLRVKQDVVLAFIRSGALRAIDVSSRPGIGKPRWRIAAADLHAFEESRTVRPATPKPRSTRRRNGRAEVIEFFK